MDVSNSYCLFLSIKTLPLLFMFLIQCYWFIGDDIDRIIGNACIKAGFNVARNRTDTRATATFKVDFVCTRGRLSINSRTLRPTDKGSICPFKIPIFFHKIHDAWFIPKLGAGCCEHAGHCHIAPQLLNQKTTYLSTSELQLCIDTLHENIPISVLQKILEKNLGTRLSYDQVAHIRNSSALCNGKTTSSADRLIAKLKDDPNVHFEMLTAKKDIGKELVTIRKTSKNKKSKAKAKNPAVDSVSSQKTNEPDTVGGFAKMVLQALSVNDDQEILLCLSWITVDAVRFFTQYPERLGVDVTFGTNQEKRPLFRGCISNSNNKNIPTWNAYLPSGANWVFKWLFLTCMPALFPAKSLAQVQIVLTDEDPQCYHNLEAAIHRGILPNAKVRLCKWHKVNRNLVLKCPKLNFTDLAVRETFVRWLYSFCDSVETREEVDVSSKMMMDWLTTSGASQDFIVYATKFWTKSFEFQIEYLLHLNYMYVRGGQCGATSFVESDNSALKRDHCGPKPNFTMERAQGSTMQHESRRLTQLKKINMRSLSKTIKKSDRGEVYGKLTATIQPVPLDLLWEQFNERVSYQFSIVNEKIFHVRKVQWKGRQSGLKHPRFDRTRIVTLKNNLMVCTCGLFHRSGITCRHIYSIINVDPQAEHFWHKHLKLYETWFGKNDSFTNRCEKQQEVFGPYIKEHPVPIEKKRLSRVFSWFQEALPHMPPIIVPLEGKKQKFSVGVPVKNLARKFDEVDGEKLFEKNAYNAMIPNVAQISNLVKTHDDFQIVKDGLQQITQSLMERAKMREGEKITKTVSTARVVSFPAVDFRNQDSRKKPFGSPSNFAAKP
jgi:hypothetical protein